MTTADAELQTPPPSRQASAAAPQPKRELSIRFLSELIESIPAQRRLAFINDLKAAIRKGTFDGGPLDDTW